MKGFTMLMMLIGAFTVAANSQLNIKYEKYTLPNGLQVILHEDHSVPIVAVNIWYHVGSAREKPGRTGFAHLFEHMMFQGSQNVAKGGHFGSLQDAGGSLNGSTANDRTNYWENVPSQFLELALYLEADRMGYLLPAMSQDKLDNQRDVVKNERRQSYDNRPYGRADESIAAMLYEPSHPYNWPVIGSMADLSAAALDDVKEFFTFYYAPNNASLVVAGDINPAQAKEWIAKYFSGIPRGKDVQKVTVNQPTQVVTKRQTMEDRVQLPRLYLTWHSTPQSGEDDATLDIVADILAGGKNSRLYKSLVYEKQIAQDVSAYQDSREVAGLFQVEVTAKPGVTLSDLEKKVNEEIAKLQESGATERETQRSKNSTKASFVYRLQFVGGFGGKADQLNRYNVMWGDPGSFNKDLERYEKVTPADVQRAAKKYLTKERTALSVVPTGKKELEAK
jgi:zinc protease